MELTAHSAAADITPHSEADKASDKHLEKIEEAVTDVRGIDPVIEKRVLRKLDRHIPLVAGYLYMLAFLDRTNIGNAKIAGMQKDLNIDSASYAWLLTIFYITYTVFEFQTLMWKIVRPHRWATITVFVWGLMATLQCAVQNWGGLMALRFFLGVAEAGFGTGIPYLMSFFYRRHELGLRCGLFLSAAPLANTFAGALAYGITSGHSKLANWRLLFLVEGLPTILSAPLAWFLLPDSPQEAKFLTAEEKEVAKARALTKTGQVQHDRKLNWKEVLLTLLDIKAWLTALICFFCNVSFSSLPVFLPQIINSMGFTAINAQGLTAPPYFLSFLVTGFTTWIADRYQQRGLMILFLTVMGGTGYVICAACTSIGLRYFGIFLAASGVFPTIANLLPWVLNNQGNDSRRGMAIVLLNLIGQCGPFLGTNVYPDSDGPRYIKGLAICAGCMFCSSILTICLRVYLVWENKRLDQQYGRQAVQMVQDGGKAGASNGEENYGEAFRYVL